MVAFHVLKAVQALEDDKDVLGILLVEADAIVPDIDTAKAAGFVPPVILEQIAGLHAVHVDLDTGRNTALTKLDGIGDQVLKKLLYLAGHASYVGQVRDILGFRSNIITE